MADWAARIASLRQSWDKLSLAVRVAVAAGALVAIGAIVFAATQQRAPHKSVLFSNLSDDDAARIVEKLKASNIPYEFGTDGTTLLVPDAQVHETRLMLASEGLPSGGGVGFEVFDQQRFGESEFSEQVKYHRALEGELARTIGHLAGVKRARVHLVLPSRSLFASDEQGASASVVVHLVPGWKMRDDQVKGIVHLVASSVRGLDPEHVTLVDGDGRALGRGSHDEGELANEADGYRREIEKSKERAAQQMLDTTLGMNKSMVRVAAAVSFTREETTEERYDPQTIAQRSFQLVEERVAEPGPGKVVTGVPGTPSNLPGGEAGQQIPPNGGGGAVPAIRRSETRNYEVSKTMHRAVEPVGRVTGLQVAVVVDGHYKGTGDKKKFEPLSKDEVDRISHLVANAIGIDEKRGDRIVVECIAFAPVTIPPDDLSALERAVGPYSQYVMYAALALLAALVWRVLGGGRKKRGDLPPPSLANVLHPPVLPGAMPAALAGIEGIPALSRGLSNAMASAAGEHPAGAQPAPEAPALPLPGATAAPAPDEEAIEQVRKIASDMASSEPEAAARVLRTWLTENAAGTANQGNNGA